MGDLQISEFHIIRILMRTDYRFFSDNSGYISNIFHYENDWIRPDNFILIEILYFLAKNRKRTGELGLEGYFSVKKICDELQKIGYEGQDLFAAINYLLKRELIIADHFNFTEAKEDDCVKIQASGYIHLRVLCGRIEYIHGLIPVIPISNQDIAAKMASYINKENQRGSATAREKGHAVLELLEFLKYEMSRVRAKNPFFDEDNSGAVYVLREIEKSLASFQKTAPRTEEQNELDFD